MTKVQVIYPIQRALGDADLKALARLPAVYGFLTVKLPEPHDRLFIEYDASRLSRQDVEGELDRHGIPIALAPTALPARS